MKDLDVAGLRQVITLLSQALVLTDRANETLLGAKIDEALECARDSLRRAE